MTLSLTLYSVHTYTKFGFTHVDFYDDLYLASVELWTPMLLDINGWTHFRSWRLRFTSKAPDNAWTPSSEMLFQLRLQNAREQEMKLVQQISSNCTKYVDRILMV